MKRNFTKILAAVALLVGLAIPLGVWGQTKTEGFEAATASSTYNSTYTLQPTNSDCGIGWTIYYGCVSTNAAISDTKSAQMRWYSSATSNLPCMYTTTAVDNLTNVAFKAKVGNKNVKMDVNYSSNGTDWTELATAVAFENTQVTEFSYDIPSGGKYIKIGVSSSSTAPTSGNYNFVVDNVVFSYSTGTTPTISFSPIGIDLGDANLVGEVITETFTISQANLTAGITLSVDNGSLSTYSIAKDAEPTEVTWTYTPTAAGAINATVTATSGETEESLEISGAAVAPVSGYTIDFESAASLYTDWTFTNMESKQTGNSTVTAHGGTYYGTTGGKASASITTKDPVAAPGTLTCYVTRQSTNATTSTWKIQVSENGSNWTDVVTQDATSMTAGTWVEFTADLTTYTNVYVRVYYTGSTAVRNIDDLSLSMNTNPAIVANDVEIAYDVTNGSIAYTINNFAGAGLVSATSNVSWVTFGDGETGATVTASETGTIPFNITENTAASPRQTDILLQYIYGESQVVTTNVTITQAGNPNATMTIAEVRALSTGTTVVTKGVVTSISVSGSNKTAYMQDNTAGIVTFGPFTTEVAVGDEIRVEGELTAYHGLLEIGKNNAAPTVTVLSQNNTVDPVVKTIAEISNDIQAQLVKVENATVTAIDGQNTTIAQGENTIVVRGISGVEYAVNDVLTLTANVGCYDNPQLTNPTNVEVQHVPSITFDPDVVDLEAEMQTIQIPFTYENIVVTNFESFTVHHYDAEGEEIQNTTGTPWYIPGVTGTNDEGYNLTVFVSANEGAARSAYMKVSAPDAAGNTVYSNLVTVNQAAYVAPSLTGTITFGSAEGSTNINSTSVTGEDSMGNTWTITTTFEGDESFTPQPGYAQVGASKKPASSITFTTTLSEAKTITSFEAKFGGFSGTAGTINLFVGESNVGTGELNETEDVVVNSTVTAEGTVLTVTVTSIEKGVKCYYISYTLEESTPAGPTITVNGYGDTNGGYVLLAWPESTSPTAINGMISDDLGTQVTPEDPGTYDLYSYDESQAMEWRNYRTNSFELVPGKGYLYASKAGVTLTYEGEASPVFADVNLPYTENKIVKSIYLAGNSQTNEQTFYVYNGEQAKQSFNYLTMNEDGNGFISAQATSYTAPAMTGFFVQAPGANMTLSTTDVNAKANVSLLNINVLRNRGSVIDNAIVSFSNGSMMDKFYLMNNTTRVYIPQGNREMAIANSAAQGEMPVSFRASENGTYTIAVEAENVDMNYLHLIDNMTGADVDLLATPNYTFEARTNDYTSRFRLVFSANGIDEQTAETFAYFNGTNWTVSNTGDATLQVVDITGRIVSSETINGNATVSLNQPAGIYMLRLVNGNDVKVQKVVVR